jgi:hypothetical protein
MHLVSSLCSKQEKIRGACIRVARRGGQIKSRRHNEAPVSSSGRAGSSSLTLGANFVGIPPLFEEENRPFAGKPIPPILSARFDLAPAPQDGRIAKSPGDRPHFKIDTGQKKMERWNAGMTGNTAGTLFIGGFDLPIIPLLQYSIFPQEVPHGRYFSEV